MSDDWAKEIAEKIKSTDPQKILDPKSAQIAKFAEDARKEAANILFKLFTSKVDAICNQIEKSERGGSFLGFFRKRTPSVITYNVDSDITFRFQMRESYGTRLRVDYQRGSLPLLKVDVATYELIEGNYLPIFRDSGAIAGAQIWQEKQSERKHPELIARLFLILSGAAVEEKFKIKDSVSWVYEEDNRRFTEESAQKILENFIALA
ncbi:MAG: hypothetical protein HY819_19910 [Acidobacteria bacterium]|nr:hypothetical protein [Acidobacteriota bacterium]